MGNMIAPEIYAGKEDGAIESVEPPGREAVIQFADAVVVMAKVEVGLLGDRPEAVEPVPPGDARGRGYGLAILFHGGGFCPADDDAELIQKGHDDEDLEGDNAYNKVEGGVGDAVDGGYGQGCAGACQYRRFAFIVSC